jgi:hypothetical protein
MRIQLRMLIATIAVFLSAAAAAAETATAVAPVGPTQSSQTAVWVTRKLQNFGVPHAGWPNGASCDDLAGELRSLLLQFGARASDLHIDERGCPRNEGQLTLIDATFTVIVPPEKTVNNSAGTLADARWQIVELRTGRPDKPVTERFLSGGDYRDCSYLEYVTKTVLPLFAARDVKLISKEICDKTGVGLRAEVLVPAQPLADTR